TSASTAMRASRSCAASIRQRSGPMPAGSPDVNAIDGERALTIEMGPSVRRRASSGRRASHPDVDERLIAQTLQPDLAFLLGLVLADLPNALLLLQLVGHVVRPPVEHLHEVPAVARAERLAELAHLELRKLL